MRQAKRLHDWDQTGTVAHLVANAARDPKRRRQPYTPRDFMPTDLQAMVRPAARGIRMTNQTIQLLKPLFQKTG